LDAVIFSSLNKIHAQQAIVCAKAKFDVQKIQNIVGIQISKIFITVPFVKFLSQFFICPDGIVLGTGFVVI